MKHFLVLSAMTLCFSCFGQKWSYDIAAATYLSTGIGESKISTIPSFSDFKIEAKLAGAISFQANYTFEENMILNTGIGISSYRYNPVNGPQWGSQNQNGEFRDIGFDENGLVENIYLSVPIGFESILQFGKLKIHPSFQLKVNYSVLNSPLISLDTDINEFFLTGSLSFGFQIITLENSSIILAPFIEAKPYTNVNDHAYSDEKLLLTGLKLSHRFQKNTSE